KAFINLIKMLIVPLIFSTIVVGIGKTGDVKAVGRMGFKALIYFEVATTIALAIGLGIAHLVRPGDGLHLPASGEQLAQPTALSEAALPRALEKMVEYGVPKSVAGFVIPAGYSFNLDGSTLYISLASLTIAQAAGIKMSLETELLMMLTFLLTSKGVAGVPR